MVDKKVIVGVVTVVLIAIALGLGLGLSFGKDDEPAGDTSNAIPTIVGTSKAIRITKAEMTDEGGGSVRSRFSYTISEPGVPFIAIHFSSFDFNRECTMELSDKNSFLVESYTDQGRKNRGSFWAPTVDGDTLNILVYCVRAAGSNKSDFVIDEIVTGNPDNSILEALDEPDQRSKRRLRADEVFPFDSDRHRNLALCGNDDGKNAVCFRDSHPTEYNLARAVARLRIAGKGVCTGWLVGPNNLVFTNMHCIESQADMDKTNFEFMAEGAQCSDSKNSVNGQPDTYSGIEIVAKSFQKDFILIRLDGDPVSKYG